MHKPIIALVFLVSALVMPTVMYAQGPTPTRAPDGIGTFLNSATPSTSSQAPAGSGNVETSLSQAGYTVVSAGNWYDARGNQLPDSVYVMMIAAASDLKSTALVGQVAAGFVALRSSYPTAQAYHTILLDRSRVMDFATTANSLELLSSSLITPDAFIKQVFDQVRMIDLVSGTLVTGSNPQQPTAPPPAAATRTPTRAAARPSATRPAPSRTPTAASAACPAPADQARLYIRNGYTGTMRFTIGGGEWGTHDYDIPGDGQYHFIDMPPGRYTYTAFIPGAGKANGDRKDYNAGQCYELNFQG